MSSLSRMFTGVLGEGGGGTGGRANFLSAMAKKMQSSDQPAPEPTDVPAEQANKQSAVAKLTEVLKKLGSGGGRMKTILTSAAGAAGTAPTEKKTLLGS